MRRARDGRREGAGGRGAVVDEGRFRFAGYRFDPESGDLRSPGDAEPVRLQPQVATLLEVLIGHRGRVVPREDLYSALWGDRHVDREQGLNYLVRQLRLVFDDDADDPRFVETIRGRGYRFVCPIERSEGPESVEPPDDAGDRTSPGPFPVLGGSSFRSRRWALALVAALALGVGALLAAGAGDGVPLADERPGPAERLALEGRYLEAKGTLEDLRRAEARYQRAVSIDPNLAPAWVGIASVHRTLVQAGVEPPTEGLELARDAAAAALEIDPDSARAHLLLGTAELYLHLDWGRASDALARAVAIDPSSADARLWHARALAAAGRFDRAIAEAHEALALDPESGKPLVDLGWFYYFAERYRESARVSRRALELAPESLASLQSLQLSLLALGNETKAREVTRAIETVIFDSGAGSPESTEDSSWLRALAERMEREACDSLVFERARLLALAGDDEGALVAIREGLDRRLWWAPFVTVDPAFAGLRGDSGFRRSIRDARRRVGGSGPREG